MSFSGLFGDQPPIFRSAAELDESLVRLAAAIEQSEVFARAGEGRLFTAVMLLSQPDGRFSFLLDHGRVKAGTGRLTSPPTIELRLTANQFHQVLSGDAHPLQLALFGGARLSGNLAQAATLSDLLPETQRLYRALTR